MGLMAMQKPINTVIFTLLSALFLLLSVKNVNAVTYISTCTDLWKAGETYFLTNDLIDIPEYRWYSGCLQIFPNSNITLDCQGHTIQCNKKIYYYYTDSWSYTVAYTGIKVNYGSGNPFMEGCPTSYSNYNTIKNCVIKDCGIGVALMNSDYNFITNVSAINNYDNIFLYCGSSFNILDNVYTQNATDYEISFYYSNNNNNTVRNSKILAYGVFEGFPCSFLIDRSYYNNFYNNFISADACYVRFYYPLIRGTYFNTTKTLATNIIGGKWIGGNYWTNSTGNSYSDICIDSDNDGFCDIPFLLGFNNFDYLPLKAILPTCGICDVSQMPDNFVWYPIKGICLFANLLTCQPMSIFLVLVFFSLLFGFAYFKLEGWFK
jgi:parallel beta-helix repeat protein